ncbi:MAG: hypothetical protein K2L39_08040, partial [Muribaculaceae bacterium]|nr:hypothetical protein [Muribaculaceae bacterium]
CPHHRTAPPTPPLPELTPRESLLDLTEDEVRNLTPTTFASLLRHSPIKRAKLAGLLRNVDRLISDNTAGE